MSVLAKPYRKAWATDSADTSFTVPTPTATEPSGDGVIDLLSQAVGWGGGTQVPRHVLLQPYGTTTDDTTFDMRVWGWKELKITGTDALVYVPVPLCDISCTLGNIAATVLGTGSLMVDTITVNDGPAEGPGRMFVSAEENIGSYGILHTFGCRFLQFSFDRTGAATCNCLVAPMDD